MTTAAPLPSVPEPLPPAQPVPEPDASAPAAARWSLARRIAFRFAFAYLFLYSFPFPLGWLPETDSLSQPVEDFWHAVVPWIGKHVLHLEQDITTFTNGSGDTTYNYVQLLPFAVLSVLAAAVWSAVDRRRAEYTKAHDVLRVYVRYVLALTMVSYGFAKLFKTQFPFPNPERLMEPLGEFSPMGLLWTFMGYSTGYNLFTGGAEFLGGVLLFFRRTTTLGALVVIGVMSNVVALNFFYDVPVKIYSSHLLLMGVFLLLPDLERLAGVLVFNRPTGTRELGMPFSLSRREVWGMLAVKVLFVGTMLHMMVSSRLEAIGKYGDRAPRPPLYGLYQVESFTRDGQAVPALMGDATRWRYVAVNRNSWVTLRHMDESLKRLRLEDDAAKSTATLVDGKGDTAKREVFTYTRPDAESLVLTGSFQGVPVEARLKKVDESKILLLNRGFNWVQEFPFNR
ncbi:MAG TPA: DoxX family protein [Myxococcus sp.]|nr:DoxX family protein [Myxococcus sp.]